MSSVECRVGKSMVILGVSEPAILRGWCHAFMLLVSGQSWDTSTSPILYIVRTNRSHEWEPENK